MRFIGKAKLLTSALVANLFLVATAFANTDYGGVQAKDASALGSKITELVKVIGMPVGGGLLFLSVVIVAIKLMVTSGNAKKRVEAMEGFLYVGIAGAVLGAALFIAGALLGIGQSLS